MYEQGTNKKLTILIIDKKERVCVLEKKISSLGHCILTAECYRTALQKISEFDFDLIVMNIDLPGGDGIQMISRIRKRIKDINIVTMIDNNNREREQETRDQRVLYYAVTPLEFSEIRSILDHLVNKTKATE